MSDELMTRAEAAQYLKITPAALEQMATRGTGPVYSKLSGRIVRYRRADIDAWIADHLQASTGRLTA